MTTQIVGYKEPQTQARVRRNTRDRILDEAARLIFEKGTSKLKLQEIADPLGITVPAIYKHFSNREDVLVALAERNLLDAENMFSGDETADPTQRLRDGMSDLVSFFILKPDQIYIELLNFSTPGGWLRSNDVFGGKFEDQHYTWSGAERYQRLAKLLMHGYEQGQFRKVHIMEFIPAMLGATLFSLVWPNRQALEEEPSSNAAREKINQIADMAVRFVTA